MLEETCNIWNKYNQDETICITTNGYIKANGQAVMGKGVAQQATRCFFNIQAELGRLIQNHGNVVQTIYPRVISFPVKPKRGICNIHKSNVVIHMREKFNPGYVVPGWAMQASIELIQQSLWTLSLAYHIKAFDKVYLPKPGCGAGGLKWPRIKLLCQDYGDWLIICDLPKENR